MSPRLWCGTSGLAAAIVACGIGPAHAIPDLQLFIEHLDNGNTTQWDGQGAEDEETWAEIGASSFRLWVISSYASNQGQGQGNTSPGIYDVTFMASFDTSLGIADAPTAYSKLSFSSSLAGGAGGFVWTGGNNPSENGVLHVNVNDSPVPNHGMLGNGRSYVEWDLGDMLLNNTPIADFEADCAGTGPWFNNDGSPGCESVFPSTTNHLGQIYAYDITVSGLDEGVQVHFDVYGYRRVEIETQGDKVELTQEDCVAQGFVWRSTGRPADRGCYEVVTTYDFRSLFAPPSHDARWEQSAALETPEPTILGLFGVGLLGLGVARRRRLI